MGLIFNGVGNPLRFFFHERKGNAEKKKQKARKNYLRSRFLSGK